MDDSDKLRLVATWFDVYDAERGVSNKTEVQDHVRRIADELARLRADNERLRARVETLREMGMCSNCIPSGPCTADRCVAYPEPAPTPQKPEAPGDAALAGEGA